MSKKENISIIERRKRESESVYLETDKEGIYLIVKVTTNSTGVKYTKLGL